MSGSLKECSTRIDAVDSKRSANSMKAALMIAKFMAGGTDDDGLGGSLTTAIKIIQLLLSENMEIQRIY